MQASGMRTRWAAIGAAVAVTLGAGGIGLVSATSPTGAVAYVPLSEPCRAADTRPGDDNVGPKSTPLGAGQTHVVNANDGKCAGKIPGTATSVLLNVTALNATTGTFLTLWASGALPLASSLNPAPGQPPVPNAVTTGITGAGNFNVFNAVGSVDVIIDVIGFYTDHNHDDRYYTKGQVDTAVGAKANSSDVYTKAQVDSKTWSSTSLTNEPGVAYDFVRTEKFLTSDPEVVAATAIRVPSDGFVEVNVTGLTRNDTAAIVDEAFCQIQLGTTGAIDTTNPWIRISDLNADAASWREFNLHRVMEIDVADNPLFFQFGQSVSLVCDETAGSVRMDEIFISATFFPTSYRPSGIIILPLSEPEGLGAEGE